MSWTDTEKNTLRRENDELKAQLAELRKKMASGRKALDESETERKQALDDAVEYEMRAKNAEKQLEAARKVADAAVGEQITGLAYEWVRTAYPVDWDALEILERANNHMRVVLSSAVREYRALTEPAA